MTDFIVGECPDVGEIDFFHSGNYAAPSYSVGWETKDAPDDTGLDPVYKDVLSKFEIPLDTSEVDFNGGKLAGIDIKNMDAVQAIRLSLAEGLVGGSWYEIVENATGGVFLVDVLNPTTPVNLDIRLCVPAADRTNQVDMVVVRGYKKPPQRYAGPWKDVIPAGTGPINPASLNDPSGIFTVYAADLVDSCVSSQLATTATKSYADPIRTDALGPQEKNPFYDVAAFENIVGWAVDIDGMPEEAGLAAAIQYKFNETTTWYYRPDPAFPSFSKVTEVVSAGCSTGGGIQTGGQIVYYEGVFNYTSPKYTDRYGGQWPLVIQPAGVLYTGYKITNIVSFGPIGADDSTAYVFVDPVHEFNELSAGSQWIYTVKPDTTDSYEIKVYYQPKQDPTFWEVVLSILDSGNVELKADDRRDKTLSLVNDMATSSPALGILGGQSDLGHYVTDMWLALTLNRPSVTVTDPSGGALGAVANLRVQYAPLILKDEPAPIGYATFGEEVEVDQTVGLIDHDPTTCQRFDETPLAIMQSLMTGNTLDVSLPFIADVGGCAAVARVIFDYMYHSSVSTYTLTCGPDDEPVLGAEVNGYDSNLRIESINYSFQDSSSYTVEVTLGPVFSNIGSWNNGAWVPKTEDVSRKAKVIWTAGDGVNYRVQVQGLGEYNAINSDPQNIWRVGEMVTVTVYNIPQESI